VAPKPCLVIEMPSIIPITPAWDESEIVC